jgi:hypothetical protein
MGIEYLNHVIDNEGEIEPAVHDLLLLFLARQPAVGDFADDALVKHIRNSRYYDKHYAVRICAQYSRLHALAELYFQLGDVPSAVQTALHRIPNRGVEIAKQFIHRVNRDLSIFEGVEDPKNEARLLRVSMWRDVIAFVAKREGGSRNALLLLSESNDEVNVSDVLPHFSDDVMMLEFREELAENVKKFQQLMTEMETDISKANKCANDLRGDYEKARSDTVRIPASKKCDACGQPALSRTMVIFRTCGHVFHVRCYSATAVEADFSRECCLCSIASLTGGVTMPLATSALSAELR